ncbi:hypothetical protein WJX72_004778 [[Myrmecia] bisecta]|uniref:Uncharacterized protein n=1 Tax=[Myrmecia] bisecta TaxID=41462 RepID=A0AAW1PPE8_9CHLO
MATGDGCEEATQHDTACSACSAACQSPGAGRYLKDNHAAIRAALLCKQAQRAFGTGRGMSKADLVDRISVDVLNKLNPRARELPSIRVGVEAAVRDLVASAHLQQDQQDLPITDRKRLWLSNNEQMRLLRKAGGALTNLAGLHATALLDLRDTDLDSLPDKLPASLQQLDLVRTAHLLQHCPLTRSGARVLRQDPVCDLAFYALPTLEQLSKATEAGLRGGGFGYR